MLVRQAVERKPVPVRNHWPLNVRGLHDVGHPVAVVEPPLPGRDVRAARCRTQASPLLKYRDAEVNALAMSANSFECRTRTLFVSIRNLVLVYLTFVATFRYTLNLPKWSFPNSWLLWPCKSSLSFPSLERSAGGFMEMEFWTPRIAANISSLPVVPLNNTIVSLPVWRMLLPYTPAT